MVSSVHAQKQSKKNLPEKEAEFLKEMQAVQQNGQQLSADQQKKLKAIKGKTAELTPEQIAERKKETKAVERKKKAKIEK